MFDEQVQESENDVSSLAWSFLNVQALKFLLAGEMPTMTGETALPGLATVGLLFLYGLLFAVLSVVLIKVTAKNEKEEGEESLFERLTDVAISGLSMTFAWCFLFGSRWLYESTPIFEENECGMNTVLGRIVLALLLSVSCSLMIFMLDSVDDYFKERVKKGDVNPGAEVIAQIVDAASILAGFSWEHAFDGGVEAVAAKTSSPLITASWIAIFVFIVIVPAWKKNILRKMMILEKYREHIKKAEAKTHSELLTTP
jgi:hypothetical protein